MNDYVNKFGFAEDVDSAGQIIWPAWNVSGADPFPAAAGQFSIVSSSTEDAVGGTGVSTVEIEGVYENGSIYEERITTETITGTTPVVLGNWDNGFRAYRMFSRDVGSNGINMGNIDITLGGNVIARIAAGEGGTEQAVYSTVSSQQLYLRHYFASMIKGQGSNPSAVIKMFVRPYNPLRSWWVAVAPLAVSGSGANATRLLSGRGMPLPQHCDIKAEVTEFDGSSATITFGFDLNSK